MTKELRGRGAHRLRARFMGDGRIVSFTEARSTMSTAGSREELAMLEAGILRDTEVSAGGSDESSSESSILWNALEGTSSSSSSIVAAHLRRANDPGFGWSSVPRPSKNRGGE